MTQILFISKFVFNTKRWFNILKKKFSVPEEAVFVWLKNVIKFNICVHFQFSKHVFFMYLNYEHAINEKNI